MEASRAGPPAARLSLGTGRDAGQPRSEPARRPVRRRTVIVRAGNRSAHAAAGRPQWRAYVWQAVADEVVAQAFAGFDSPRSRLGPTRRLQSVAADGGNLNSAG